MERLHVNNIRDIIHRLQQGQSKRQIAKDLRVSRHTAHKYRQMAERALPGGTEGVTLPSADSGRVRTTQAAAPSGIDGSSLSRERCPLYSFS